VWPAIQEYCGTWDRVCQPCQRAKALRHTVTTFCNFPLPPSRCLQIHIDLVGPLPSSAGFQYCLTALDRFTRPTLRLDIRFGCPQTITTEQGRQFDSQVFHCLAKLCGIHLCRMSPHHPAANGLVKRLHGMLKAANVCHADEQWTEAFPLVLLGIRTAYKEDLQLSAAELVYGETLRAPGELLAPSARPSSHPPSYSSSATAWTSCDQPRQHAIHTLPRSSTETSRIRPRYFYDAIRRALDPPYSVPHKVIARTDKTFKIIVRGRQVTVSSLHRFWTGPDTTSLATPAAHQPNHTALQSQQSHDHFRPMLRSQSSFQHLLSSPQEGDVGTSHVFRNCPSHITSPTTNRWSFSLQLLQALTANQSKSSFYSFRNSGIKVYCLP
jgi:hypothetical protein